MFAWTKHWPRVAIGCLLLFLTLLGWSGAHVWRLINADINPTVDNIAKLNQLLADSQPVGDNAWDVYRDLLVNDLGLTTQGSIGARWHAFYSFTGSGDLLQGAWADVDRSQAIAQLKTYRDLFDKLDLAARMPVFIKPYPHGGDALIGDQTPTKLTPAWSILLPELGTLRRLEKLNAFEMRAAAETGDWDEVVRRFKSGLALGKGLTNQGTIIENIVSVSIMAISTGELARLLNEHNIPIKTDRALLNAIDSLHFSARAINHHLIDGEMLIAEDMIQWLYSDDGHGGGAFLPGPASTMIATGVTSPTTFGERLLNPLGALIADRKTTTKAVHRFSDEVHQYIDTPVLQRAPHEVYMRTMLSNPSLVVMNMVTPVYTHAVRTTELIEEKLAAIRVMLLLEIHHSQTGAWPATLAEAMDEQDRRDPVMGEPFIYRLTPGDPAGRPYELRLPAPDKSDAFTIVNPPREPLPMSGED